MKKEFLMLCLADVCSMKSSTSNTKTQTAPIVYKQTKLAPKYKFSPETLKYWVGF